MTAGQGLVLNWTSGPQPAAMRVVGWTGIGIGCSGGDAQYQRAVLCVWVYSWKPLQPSPEMGSDVLAGFSSLHGFLGQVEAVPSLKMLKARLNVGPMLHSGADSLEVPTQSSTHWHFQDPAALEEGSPGGGAGGPWRKAGGWVHAPCFVE